MFISRAYYFILSINDGSRHLLRCPQWYFVSWYSHFGKFFSHKEYKWPVQPPWFWRNGSMWLLKLGNKKTLKFLSCSLLNQSWGSQLPCDKDTQISSVYRPMLQILRHPNNRWVNQFGSVSCSPGPAFRWPQHHPRSWCSLLREPEWNHTIKPFLKLLTCTKKWNKHLLF